MILVGVFNKEKKITIRNGSKIYIFGIVKDRLLLFDHIKLSISSVIFKVNVPIQPFTINLITMLIYPASTTLFKVQYY